VRAMSWGTFWNVQKNFQGVTIYHDEIVKRTCVTLQHWSHNRVTV